jgi:hypothetical protein
VSMDPDKVVAMREWPKPKNLKALQRFLGLIEYYCKFIHYYGKITRPLTQMLMKEYSFTWTHQAEHVFEELKQAMTKGPVLV